MKNRKNRINLMINLIRNKCISSQEELVQLLADRGYKVTQATLSRDLKILRTTKVPTDRGTYIYTLPNSNTLKDKILVRGHLNRKPNFHVGFISLSFSGNIAVIKTRNGYAAGLAFDIDTHNFPEILGTIPGSDTIFAVLREDVTHEEARNVLGKVLPLPDNPKTDEE